MPRRLPKELIESMQEAAKHAAGKKVRGLRVSKMELPDVRAIRLSLKMSQHHFAAAYRIPLPHFEELGAGKAHARCARRGLSAGDQAASEGNHGSRRAAVRI